MVDELRVPWLDSWIYFGNCNAPSTVSICGLCQRTCKNFVIIYYFKVPRFNYTYSCIFAELVYIVDTIIITFTFNYNYIYIHLYLIIPAMIFHINAINLYDVHMTNKVKKQYLY